MDKNQWGKPDKNEVGLIDMLPVVKACKNQMIMPCCETIRKRQKQ
jgi:hypothetical protein